MAKRIKIKRIYCVPEKSDGIRILVDRLWPRGISKQKANIDHWLKDIAPSNGLRKWFNHDPQKWEEFKKRYHEELLSQADALRWLKDKAAQQDITLLFATSDEKHNNAVALKGFLS